MDVSYYPTGSTVISPHDYHSGLFIILDGEVVVIDGGQHVATLEVGEYFGDISVFLNVKKNSADISASKMSKIGHIDNEDMDKLKCAFPDWTQAMQ